MDLFRKPKKRQNVSGKCRKSEKHSSDDEVIEINTTSRKRKRPNRMVQSSKKTDPQEVLKCSSDSESDENDDVAIATHSFSSSGMSGPAGPSDQGATATLEIDTDRTMDAQAQFERVQEQLKEGLEKDGKTLYKGAAMYGAKEAKDTIKGNAASGMNRIGPVRAPQFLRQTVRWDFAPDICKDYKETGFCTFGDSCKFVHDRSDYKHGWEIDKEFEEGRYGVDDETNYEINEEDDQFPDQCFICGEDFVDPIVTKCKHYFCEKCALKTFRCTSKCPVCHQNTDKIMNTAKDLLQYLRRKETKNSVEEVEQIHVEGDGEVVECDTHSNHESSESGEDEPESEERLSAGPEDEVEIVMEKIDDSDGGENEEDSESQDSD